MPSNTYGTTSQLNEPYTYESTNYQYNEYNEYTQPNVETITNEQVISSYDTNTPVVDTLPTINPADQLEETPVTVPLEYNVNTDVNPLPLEYNVNTDLAQENIGINENEIPIESNPQYNTHTEYQMIHTKTVETKPIELENQGNLTDRANATKPLSPPVKPLFDDMSNLRSQLQEINTLRSKLIELSSVKAQIAELQHLKQQAAEIDLLKKKLDELKALQMKNKSYDTEILKKKIENLEKINTEYEKEIKYLRKYRPSAPELKSTSNLGLDAKKVVIEEKAEKNECVKGDIIHDMKELEMITKKINKSNKKLTINLLYKATVDSDKAEAFHEKCDDADSTIVLVETDNGKRFGGYTSCSWAGDCIEKEDENAFVFSLDKMKTYDNIPGEDAIGCYPKFGPIFLGCQIRIYDNAFTKGGTTYEKGLNYSTEEDFELTDGERTFKVKEIEVYEVIPN